MDLSTLNPIIISGSLNTFNTPNNLISQNPKKTVRKRSDLVTTYPQNIRNPICAVVTTNNSVLYADVPYNSTTGTISTH